MRQEGNVNSRIVKLGHFQKLEREGCKMKSKTVELEILKGLKELRRMLA